MFLGRNPGQVFSLASGDLHPHTRSHGSLSRNNLLLKHTGVSDRSHLTHASARAYRASPHLSTTTTTPASGSSSSGKTPNERRKAQAKKAASSEHPLGSERWKKWTQQLQLGGLSPKQADSALRSSAFLLQREPANTDDQFQQMTVTLLCDTGLTAEQFKQLLMVCPDFLRVTQTDCVVGNFNWFKVILGVSTVEWMQIALACPPLATLRKDSLQQRLDILTGLGLDRAAAKACWMRNPRLINISPASMQDKLAFLQALFSISGAEIIKQHPAVLLHPSKNLRDRVLFLQLLGSPVVSLTDVQHGISDSAFALQSVGAHMQASGKTLPQLCLELQAMPGVREFLEKHHVDATTMTAYKYFLVAKATAGRPQDSPIATVVSTGHTSAHTQLSEEINISSSATTSTTPTSSSTELPPNSGADSSLLGDGREGQAAGGAVQEHLPGGVRWNQWASQLQLLGLTSEEADSALSSLQPMLKRAPANTDEKLKSLIAAILRGTGLTAHQLQQITRQSRDILRMTRSEEVVGNFTWFRDRLGMSTEEWVQLVCNCRPLFAQHKLSLQQRMDELMVVGFDAAGVKACWIQNPDLLKMHSGQLLDKVAILETLFPGISVMKVLRTDPSVLLYPTRNLRDRILFVQTLGSEAVSLVDVQHGLSDAEFAVRMVGLYLASSGKSLLQLCSELQAQPQVAAFMQAVKIDPATMGELWYYHVAVKFAHPQQEASVGASPDSE